MFKKVTLCGMGVMGASLGYTLIRSKLAKEVVGFVRREEVIPQLIRLKLAHKAFTSLEAAVKDAEIIVLCVPVALIPRILKEMISYVKPGTLIMDVGSVKTSIVSSCERIAGNKAGFMGCHPMTGTEKFGFENYVPDLYQGAPCILTPTDHTPKWVCSIAGLFWKQLKTKV